MSGCSCTGTQREPLVSDWEDTYPSFRVRPRTLPDLLRWRAEVSGAATALIGPDGRMSFAE